MAEPTRYLLPEDAIPTSWYNLAADLPVAPPPVLHPGTHQPIGPDDLAPLFPMAIIGQEVSTERFVPIPEEVLSVYRLWRPTPLHRAHRLEKALDLPQDVRIFYKYEGVSPAGSHKPNTAIPQAYYAKQEGVKRIATETGAGQWGSALALAGSLFDLEIKVYMVKISYAQKPYRRALMETWGAQCVASPSQDTNAGRAILERDPDSNGSLGIAISEAVEDAATREDTKYALGSVLNHVLLHQTVIGQEAIKQLEMADAYPDVVIGCVGGGSNFAGISFPFVREKLAGKPIRIIAAEPAACPTLTRGVYAYDFGDTGQLTPLVKMHTLGEFHYDGDTFDDRFVFAGPCLGDRAGFQGSWQPPGGDRPVLLVSLGSAATGWAEFFPMCLDAFGHSGWHVVLAVGDHLDPADLGRVPANVEVHRQVPQLDVLEHASLFITHGGMNSTMESLYHGVPMVVIPQMNEQRANALRVDELGLGRYLPRADATVASLRSTVVEVSADTGIRDRVENTRQAMRKINGPVIAADAIEAFLPDSPGARG